MSLAPIEENPASRQLITIIPELDIYVSDGSEDDDEDVDVVIAGSRMGIMRRGLTHASMLVQPNRQWVRNDAIEASNDSDDNERQQQEEDELAKLDPAQRAARLLQEKQRKLEQAKEDERRGESEENAGRDPHLFSKRTAFDIRFDQIDDKPWTRGTGDLSDFFNYGLAEEDWLEYGQQQLLIRQELTDASRQKRTPDPNIVPVLPRAPESQTPRVAVSATGEDAEENDAALDSKEAGPAIGPVMVKKEEETMIEAPGAGPDKEDHKEEEVDVGIGGAWGAGAAPGSTLAKLIEEQERNESSGSLPPQPSPGDNNWSQRPDRMPEQSPSESHTEDASQGDWRRQDDYHGHGREGGGQEDYYGGTGRGGYYPPLPDQGFRGRGRGGRGFPGRFGGRGGRGGRGPPPQWEGGRGGGDYYSRKRPREDPRDPRWRR